MRIGAAGNHAVSCIGHPLGQRLRIEDYLLLISREFGLHRFQEAYGLGSDHVDERPALNAGEQVLVDRRTVLLFRQNQAGTGSA